MKTLIALNNPDLKNLIFGGGAIEKLERFSQVDWLEDYDDLGSVIGEYEACITSWGSPRLTPEILEKAGKLRFIGHGAGTVVPYVDEQAFIKGITVVNANYVLSHATAEGAVAMMAAGSYQLLDYNRLLLSGGWADNDVETVLGLYRQNIGIIGYGDISKEVIRLLEPYEAHIRLFSGHCSQAEADELGVELCSLEELLTKSNVVSLHNTLTPKTKGMIGRNELNLLKEGSLLVNTARSPIIQEDALLETLETGRINAILDVYDKEPLPMEHSLHRLSNVWLLPHVAAYASYWKTRLIRCVVDDLERYLCGEALNGEITLSKYRRLSPE